MKNTKRILATLITIIMLVGLLAVPAMAANITIKDTNNDNYYTIYKIFDYDATNSFSNLPMVGKTSALTATLHFSTVMWFGNLVLTLPLAPLLLL